MLIPGTRTLEDRGAPRGRATLACCAWPVSSERAIQELLDQGAHLVLGSDAVLACGEYLSFAIVARGLGFAANQRLADAELQAKRERRGLWERDPKAKDTFRARTERCSIGSPRYFRDGGDR